jgi:hypothetical protein
MATKVTSSLIDYTSSSFTGNFRNKIINGNFDIWQRGTSLANGTGARYLADRFTNGSVGSTYTPSRQSFTLGQTDVPGEPTYFHRTVVTSVAGTSNNATLHQHVESVRTLAGRTATLSFYAKADAAKNIAVELYQNFGTGGSPSSNVSFGVTTCALTTSWQKFTVTVDVPTLAGKTIGTNRNDSLTVYFWLNAGSGFNSRTNSLGQQSGTSTFDIARVQLEEGLVATPFEERFMGNEMMLCQRYYETSIHRQMSYSTLDNNHETWVVFKVEKRTIPTIVLSAQSLGDTPNIKQSTAEGAGDYLGSITTSGFGYACMTIRTGGMAPFFTYAAVAEL